MGERIQLSFDRGTLLLSGPTRTRAPRTSREHVWRWDPRVGAWRADALHYQHAVETIGKRAPTFRDEVPERLSMAWPREALPALRPEQRAAVEAWAQKKRGVVVMPTGTGKTEVALDIMRELRAATLVVAPVRDLMYQWHQRIFDRLGYDAGIIGDNIHVVRPVSVTTYDSACIYMEQYGATFDLLVFDECHHLPGRIRRDAALMSVAPFRLGLTATPERSDGRHVDLNVLIGPVVYSLPLETVKGSTLADYEVVRIPVHLTHEERLRYDSLSRRVRGHMAMRVREKPGYGWDDLCADATQNPDARRILQAKRMKDKIEDRADEKLKTLEDLFRLHAEERVLVFAGSNPMAREVSRRFLIPCLLHHCGKRERMDILGGFREGRYRAIVANQVLDEGVDIPAAKVGVVIGGSASTKQAKQRLGRILRKQGEQRAVLYEVVCEDTGEEQRSRRRRRSDAYQGTRYRRI